MIVFENEYARIEQDEQNNIIVMTWKKYTPSTPYRELITKYYEIRIERKIFRTISDCRLLPTINAEDYQWSVEISKKYTVLLDYSLLKNAVILSGNAFTKLSIEGLLKEFTDHPEYTHRKNYIKYFTDMEEAKRWVIEDQQDIDNISGKELDRDKKNETL